MTACNLYSVTKGQAAIRNLFAVSRDSVGNLPSMPGIFPDYPAPIIRNADGIRELTMARWGMPSSSQSLFEATKKRAAKLEAKGKQVDFKELLRMEPDKGTTNLRNVESKHWKPWLSRCGILADESKGHLAKSGCAASPQQSPTRSTTPRACAFATIR